jgi:hypothetical protein
MKIKNYIWVVLVLGFAGIPSAAQRVSSGLSAPQRAAAVDTSLGSTCREKTPKVPRVNAHDAQVFSTDRIERTLNGVWHGRVKGNYDKKFLAKDGFVNVDYYMIVDAKRGEALVFEQFGPKRAAPQPKAGTPTWSYVFCDRANYKPRHPPQVHTFYKVSDNVEDGRAILRASTGLALAADKGALVLADVWQQLVDTKYFDDPSRSLAYAGGFFKPFKMGNVPAVGGSLFSMDMTAEYRGSGMTAARFERGVPMRGYERGKFLGIGTNSGDYLVSSIALGEETTTDKSVEEDSIGLKYDKIVIGPLAPAEGETSKVNDVPRSTSKATAEPRARRRK